MVTSQASKRLKLHVARDEVGFQFHTMKGWTLAQYQAACQEENFWKQVCARVSTELFFLLMLGCLHQVEKFLDAPYASQEDIAKCLGQVRSARAALMPASGVVSEVLFPAGF